MEETWKVIDGYENYEVSNLGNVRSVDRLEDCNGVIRVRKGTVLKQTPNKQGYITVGLLKHGTMKRVLVHRLVATAFVPNPDNLPQVNHKDECKTNNVACNLEWCTCKYNLNYGSHNQKMIESLRQNRLCKKVLQYSLDGTLIRIWNSAKEVQRTLGFWQGNVSLCCRGEKNVTQAYGYVWRYSNS